MRIEVRADDTVRITGYVNAVERESRPVITTAGKVNERVESGVFRRALEHGGEIPMTIDHDPERVAATTADGSLRLTEDGIGLRADTQIKDAEVARCAREGKIRGWSFGMRNVKDEIEERAGKLPLRRIRDLTLDHVSLIIRKYPCYSATSIELRADGERETEVRAFLQDEVLVEEERRAEQDYSQLDARIAKLREEKKGE